jgi:protein-S-isoprenylcysteine O-methyltransferase Ste14
MIGATRAFIGFCWLAWLLYWVIMAFATKRTIERKGLIGYRVVGVVALLGCLVIGGLLGLSSQSQSWRTTFALGVVTDAIVLAGAAFTVWARVTLGRNWSGEVTFKQGHELIETGPYALVRHPIYTGLIVMALGTAINYGRAIGFALLISLCASLWWKLRQEEQMMSSHFPAAYSDYRARVRAIIPFLL